MTLQFLPSHPALTDTYSFLPNEQAPHGLEGMLGSDLVLISMLVRMRLTVMGQLTASVPFTRGGSSAKMELLVGEEARVARRHVAAHTLPETLSVLRAKAPKSSKT